MTWTRFHRRGEVLREVVATANTRRDGLLPTDVPGVTETFADDLELLGALQLKWHTRLAGQVERALSEQPLDLPGAVATAWAATSDVLPGVRLVVDHYRAAPTSEAMAAAMATATRKEHAYLAAMAGLAGIGDDEAAAPIGARLEERARTLHRGAPVVPADDVRPTWLDRLRAAFAA
ncbi:hypothetical protein GCM10023340_17470 [Nocardioides marinquilinus]|uniref:DUF222 domain-containing protein n=1 Tax=Nocardioides marinquilinus TaxID=1210400 RepID=A0ABP9PH58_9ACTN